MCAGQRREKAPSQSVEQVRVINRVHTCVVDMPVMASQPQAVCKEHGVGVPNLKLQFVVVVSGTR